MAGDGKQQIQDLQESIEERNDIWEPITKPFLLKQAYSLGVYDEEKKKKPAPVVGEHVAEAKKLFEQRSLEMGLTKSTSSPVPGKKSPGRDKKAPNKSHR